MVGVYEPRLLASLPDFTGIIDPALLSFQVTLIHPCSVSEMYPVLLNDMRVSVHEKTTPAIQLFNYARNTYELTTLDPHFCGVREYVIRDLKDVFSDAEVIYDPVFVGKWSIQSMTHDKNLIGDHVMQVTVGLADFPEVPTVETKFNITVFDDCNMASVMIGT